MQIVLDFLEGFTSPAIEQRFIDTVNEKIHQTRSKLTKDIKDQFFKELSKKEFFLLECFARFFASILAINENLIESAAKAALRVCISLTATRKKLDRLFLRRNLIGEHDQDDQVTHLKIFLSKWVENFNEEFTQNFMVHKSALKITEKKVREKLIRKGIGMTTYLSKVLESRENLDESYLKSPPLKLNLKKFSEDDIDEPYKIVTNSQAASESGEIASKKVSVQNGIKSSLLNVKLPLVSDSVSSSRNNASATVDSTQKLQNSSDMLMTTPLSRVLQKSFSVPKILYEAEMTPSSKAKAFRQNLPSFNPGRKSLLKVDDNLKIQENVSALAKLNIERHYDNFFGQQIKNSQGSIQEEEELNGKESLENIDKTKFRQSKRLDTVQNLFGMIEKLDAERQDLLFQKLLELQIIRNNNK